MQRPQEESTTIAVIIKDILNQNMNNIINSAMVMYTQGKEFLKGNIHWTQVILMVET